MLPLTLTATAAVNAPEPPTPSFAFNSKAAVATDPGQHPFKQHKQPLLPSSVGNSLASSDFADSQFDNKENATPVMLSKLDQRGNAVVRVVTPVLPSNKPQVCGS